MKRSDLLACIRIAGYHNDLAEGTRIFVENRISRQAYDEAFRKGAEMKRAGIKCSCFECKNSK